jgi:hypothetical protein
MGRHASRGNAEDYVRALCTSWHGFGDVFHHFRIDNHLFDCRMCCASAYLMLRMVLHRSRASRGCQRLSNRNTTPHLTRPSASVAVALQASKSHVDADSRLWGSVVLMVLSPY